MTLTAALVYALFGGAAGLLIGCVGVGGVILVPALAYLVGTPIHVAIAGAMFAYLLSGTIGTLVFARNNSIRWDMTAWMWLGASPAALAGALAASSAPGHVLELAIGLLTAASGAHALMGGSHNDEAAATTLSAGTLGVTGAFTGFTSALTGTGGPLVLVPILLWLQMPVLTAIGLSQAIQLPIAVLATVGNYWAGTLDVLLGLAVGVGISGGTLAGAKLAHALPRKTLRAIVAGLLVLVGGSILLKFALSFL